MKDNSVKSHCFPGSLPKPDHDTLRVLLSDFVGFGFEKVYMDEYLAEVRFLFESI